MIGQRLGGKYDIQSEIGRGGMGIVYRAQDVMLRRPVAVKVLAPQLAMDPLFLQRFEQEAVTAANLRHPNIVTIHDVGTEPTGDRFGQTIHYIVMELLDGVTLDQWLARPGDRPDQAMRVSLAQAEHIVRQVADALQYAHEQGVIHRDVKPSNIMLNAAGRATLMDFGLVRAGEGTGLTRSGLVVGTPEYMAPEQAMGGLVDGRTDIYSFGVVIYKLLTGQVPFARTTPVATAHAHVYETPPPLRLIRPELPKPVEGVVMKALAKEPGQRYQQAGELAADFSAVAVGKTPVWLKPSGAAERKATPAPGASQGKGPSSTPKPAAAKPPAADPADPTRIIGAASVAPATRAEPAPPRASARRPSLLAGLALLVLALVAGAVLLSLGGSRAEPIQTAQSLKNTTPTVAVRQSGRSPTVTLAAARAVAAPASQAAAPAVTPTATAAPTASPEATATATLKPTATPKRPTSTSTPTEAPTRTPTPTARLATEPAATNTPQRTAPATATPLPTATPKPAAGQAVPAPQLGQPADGQSFAGPIGDVVLSWEPAPLPEGACYMVAIRYRHNTDTWTDVHCQSEPQMALPAYLADLATDPRFEWQVTVMRPKGAAITSEADGEPLGPSSPPRIFFWAPPSSGGGEGGGGAPPTRPAPLH